MKKTTVDLFKKMAGPIMAVTALSSPLAACSAYTFDTMQDARIRAVDGPSYINGFAKALNDLVIANNYDGYFEGSDEFTTSRQAFAIGATHALTCISENMALTARKKNRPIERMGKSELLFVRGQAMNDCEEMVLKPYHRSGIIRTYSPLLKRL